MASSKMSSTLYLKYLNDYINLNLNDTNEYLIENLNQSYFDEIENHARFILAEWYSEQIIDEQSLLYIKNVSYLNRKIVLLTYKYSLNKNQVERIKNLLFNSEIIQLLTSIIQSIIETNLRHQDNFLYYLSILINVYSIVKYSKPIFNQITKQAIQSKYYKQYLTELFSINIQPIHLFFIGTIGQLAQPIHDSTFNELYSKFFTKFYNEKILSDNNDLHYCTLGILSQIDISYLINDYSCISILLSIFINSSSKFAKENTKILLLPILNIFNLLCIQSKTVACYLNSDQLIDILLQYIINQQNYQLNINACLLLGHIISEKQLIQLRISYKLTMKFMNLLYCYKQEIKNILQSLLSLTIHEQIQYIIADTYQLQNLIELSENYPIIYDIIWKLSFHSDILEQLIKRHNDFLEKLSSLSNIPAANGILENIQMRNLSRLPIKDGISFDIALISSVKDRLVVQSIQESFEKFGFRIGTIRNSFNILLCISEESKHDCTCQAAIRKALLDCKKIILCIVQKSYRFDDWFNILNIDEKKLFKITESNIEKMISEIQIDLNNNNNNNNNSHNLPAIVKHTQIVTPLHRTSHTNLTSSSSSSKLQLPTISSHVQTKKIQNWTHQEVLEWCAKNNLNAFTKILTLYDGRSLIALAHISRMNAPHTIMNQLRNDCRKHGLKLSFVEFVHFQAALDELLRFERNQARKQSVSTLATRYVFKRKNKK
ncbi:unnamed protein product [Rotaria sordida]|uniref:Uncharacterized protein n=1 Tax=Rotaria sordida TaxID=392033 RepID=A0A818X4B6_9BILA|nr:unnamed protein product [Rotaria sordida]CAF3732410.1 unnamed protein product [Rotaria sordida]